MEKEKYYFKSSQLAENVIFSVRTSKVVTPSHQPYLELLLWEYWNYPQQESRFPETLREYKTLQQNKMAFDRNSQKLFQALDKSGVYVCENRYPYDRFLTHFNEMYRICFSHQVLWSCRPLPDSEIHHILEREVPHHSVVVLENAPKGKSIPSIPHYQLFVLLI